MNLKVTAVIQALAAILHYLNLAGEIAPEKYKPLVAGLILIAQGLNAVFAHFWNPDGTKAIEAWMPNKPKGPGFPPGAGMIALVCVALIVQGCPQKQTDPLYEIARASHRIANAIDKARSGIRELKARNLIDTEEALAVSRVLRDLTVAADDATKRAREYVFFDTHSKAAIVKLIGDLRDFIATRVADGSVRIRNPAAQARWTQLIGVIATTAQAIYALVNQLEPVELVPALPV
jgi:hypothetical protein